MTLKPVIANPEVEFDARQITEDDWDQTAIVWPDTSGQSNDGLGAGSFARFEDKGFGGELPAVRVENGSQDGWTFSGTALATTRHTVFIVLEAINIANHLGIWGSDAASSPGARFIQIFAKSDGSLIYNRSLDTYDVQSAAGVIVEGGRYVITARVDATAGMTIRVNGVQVGVNVGESGANLAFAAPTRIGRINDQITGGVGSVFGDKRYRWVSFHNSALSDADVDLWERYLGTQHGIAIGEANSTKPTVVNQEGEYDIVSYSSQDEGDQVGTWTDTSGNGNDATIVGTPEYEAGTWSPGQEDVRFISSGQVGFDGSGFAAEDDIILFIVFRTFDQSSAEPLTGGSSFTARTQIEIFIRDTGSIIFSFGTDEGALAVESAAGEIVADGTCYVLTLQFSSTSGKLIRKAVAGLAGTTGAQVAINAASTATLLSWNPARIADIVGVVPSNYMKMAWLSGHLTAPPLDQIEQMETWLLETFCGQDATVQFPRDVLPERSTGMMAPGVIRHRFHSGTTQIRATKALGWSWKEDWNIFNVRDPNDMLVMAFIKKARNRGTVFEVRNLMVPGSGMSPNGLGTAGIQVQGGGQLGGELTTDGWPSSTLNVVRAGDVIKVGGDDAVYMITEDSDSDGAGASILRIMPQLRLAPFDNASVITSDVPFRAAIINSSRFDGSRAPTHYAGQSVTFVEALLP